MEEDMFNALESVQLLQPKAADRYFADGLELDAEQAGLVVGRLGVVVDQHGHQLAVQDVDAGAAPGDDSELVPVVHFDQAAEGLAVADGAQKALLTEAGP